MGEKKFNHDEYLKEYRKNVLVRIALDMKRGKRDEIKRHADACGETMAGYVKKAVEMRMASESVIDTKKAEAVNRENVLRTFGTSIGDGGKEAAEKNRKQGRIVKDGKHGFMVVYAPEEEDSL